jgi:methylated-DNA-[protein]-cysteine S-methyltransferase
MSAPLPSPTHTFSLHSPVGWLRLVTSDKGLLQIAILQVSDRPDPAQPREEGWVQPIVDYFEDARSAISLPLDMRGTPFQLRAWQALRQIPCGQTRNYGQLARQLNTSPRAVGNACRANPCPIVVPCHRVVSQSGIGGFSGQTRGELLEIKRWLLRHEGVRCD